MNHLARISVLIGALLCFVAIALGAFGSHALAPLLIENARVDTFELANRYHFYHGIALIALSSVVAAEFIRAPYRLILAGLTLGTLIFSGTLYTLSLTNLSVLGAITPIGGALLLVSWLVFAWACAKNLGQAQSG